MVRRSFRLEIFKLECMEVLRARRPEPVIGAVAVAGHQIAKSKAKKKCHYEYR